MTHEEFLRTFPSSDACLDYLKDRFYPDGTLCPGCSKASKFHRISGRSAYSCQFCGTHVYPTAGTIFHKSTTSLHLWFWTIFLMSSTRCELSTRELEREIGVAPRTAQRMVREVSRVLGGAEESPSGRVWQSGRRRS